MSLLTHLGFTENLSTFVGGMFGFIGAEEIRKLLFSLIRKKLKLTT
ncbi:phage holin family protein [Necropsobacter massiliensis]|nr:phage holin family protein [Necropsobacter massiliensis]